MGFDVSTAHARPKAAPCINEVDRHLVEIPDPHHVRSGTAYIPVLTEQTRSGTIVHRLLDLGPGLNFPGFYRVMDILCGDRAQRCLDGQLLVNGQEILPERYLGLWRGALQRPIALPDVAMTLGQSLVAIFDTGLEDMPEVLESPQQLRFRTKDEVLRRFMDPQSRQAETDRFHVELALDCQEAIEEAFCLQFFLHTDYDRRQRAVHMRLAPGHTAQALFFHEGDSHVVSA